MGPTARKSSGSTYFWESVGGDFEALWFRKEEADKKAHEPLHCARLLCPALQHRVWKEPTVPWATIRGTTEPYSWFSKRELREKRRRELSNFAPKQDKYLFWSSNLSWGWGGGSHTQRLFKQQSWGPSLGCESKAGSDRYAVLFFFFLLLISVHLKIRET